MSLRDTVATDSEDLAKNAEESADPPIGPLYPNAAAWVQSWLVAHYARNNPGFRWCRYWWDHAEAASRLESLWQAWEQARADDDMSAISTWWSQHCDPHMTLLVSDTGPFSQCDAIRDQHHVPDPLPVEPPPEGMYRGWDHPEEQHDDAPRG